MAGSHSLLSCGLLWISAQPLNLDSKYSYLRRHSCGYGSVHSLRKLQMNMIALLHGVVQGIALLFPDLMTKKEPGVEEHACNPSL